MTPRRWIFQFCATLLVVFCIVGVAAYITDPYGVWRDPQGRKLPIYFGDRKAKFLLSKRYVPANFDGLIIGPSASTNWDVSTIGDARIYNESLMGGNAAEEDLIVSQALQRGHFKVAVIVVMPYVTRQHTIEEGMDSTNITEAIGSIHLFVNEIGPVLSKAGIKFRSVYAAPNGQLETHLHKNLEVGHDLPYQIDPIAAEKLKNLAQVLQSRGTKIVYVVPPYYAPYYEVNKALLQSYYRTIFSSLPPAPVIDFNTSAFDALRSNPDNYFDSFHMEAKAAAKVGTFLSQLVPQAIARGQLEQADRLQAGGAGGGTL